MSRDTLRCGFCYAGPAFLEVFEDEDDSDRTEVYCRDCNNYQTLVDALPTTEPEPDPVGNMEDYDALLATAPPTWVDARAGDAETLAELALAAEGRRAL